MKLLKFVIVMCLFLVDPTFGDMKKTTTQSECAIHACSKNSKGSEKFKIAKIIEFDEKRGCCSWHGGVCGCSVGRAVCCDGTVSPSCGCD